MKNLYLFLLCGLLCAATFTARAQSGTTGNLSWEIVNGVLKISGTGAMPDYTSSSVPWASYRNNITAVNIGKGVTSIGSYAFAYCAGLRSVTIPESVTLIGNLAFVDCLGLAQIINQATTPQSISSNLFDFIAIKSTCKLLVPEVSLDAYSSASYWSEFVNRSGLGELTVFPASVTIFNGRTVQLQPIVLNGQTVNWTSSNTAVATVDAQTGTVTAVAAGTATITATAGAAQAACTLTVTATVCDDYTAEGITGSLPWAPSWALSWALCKDGTLTITGNGDMPNYSSSPWYSYRSNITAVNIGEGVTSIGNSAFGGCSGLTSITIPGGVTVIGRSAFSGCSGLTSITIPDGVTSIGSSAFYGCSGLTSITISGSVTAIGDHAFWECSGITSITIPGGVTAIAEGAFANCSGLASIEAASSNPNYSSGNGVLFNKDKTTLIQYPQAKTGAYAIPGSVTSIGDMAFWGCSGLTSIAIPDGVTAIGMGAFDGCNSLKTITIPDKVTSISSYAFLGCTGLTEITNHAATPQVITSFTFYNLDKSIITLRVPASSVDAYRNAEVWKDFGSIQAIGSGPCANPTASGTTGNLTWTLCPDGVLTISGTGAMLDYAYNGAPWDSYHSSITAVNIGEGITDIANRAFSYCSGMTSITIPNSVTAIGNHAFAGCSGLTSITIPESVTAIGEVAFYSCSGLTSITIPNSVATIGEAAFASCSGLTSIAIPESVTAISDFAFADCSGLTSIEVASSNSSYSSENGVLFNKDKTTLKQYPGGKIGAYTIPGSVTAIGSGTFYYCSGLTSVISPEGITVIGDRAFEGCSGLTSVNIPESVTAIGVNAFGYCSGLTSITIPKLITVIGGWAFYGCTSLTEVINHAATPQTIDASVFENVPLSACTLRVPAASVDAYRNAEVWKDFKIEAMEVPVTGVSLNITAMTLVAGSSATLAATVTPEGADPAVIWRSSRPGVAAVDGQGRVTGVSAGTTVITATAGAKTAVCTVKVISGTASIDGTVARRIYDTIIRIILYLREGSSTWSVMEKTSVPGGYIQVAETFADAGGYYRFDNLTEGDYIVVVETEEVEALSGNITMDEGETVSGLDFTLAEGGNDGVTATVDPAVTGIEVLPDAETVKKGAALQFTATAETHGGASPEVTWSVSGNSAPGTTVNGTGLLTVAAEESASALTVTATSAFDNTRKGSATVTVEGVTGVGELDAPDLKAYPNPFTGLLHLTGAEGCTLRVVNAAGTTVHTQNIESPDETIRLEHLPAGVYFFRFEKDGKATTVKAVKE